MWNDLNVAGVGQWKMVYNDPKIIGLKQAIQDREQMTQFFKTMGLVEYRPVTEKDIYLRRNFPGGDEAAAERERAMLLEISKLSFPLGIAHLTQDGIAESTIGNWRCRAHTIAPNIADYVECDIPLAYNRSVEVTGITQSGPVASADYTRSYIPNHVGQQFLKEIESFPTLSGLKRLKNGDTGRARFQLYDDGWRIVR